MNPAKISTSDCHLDAPVKKSSGKISFCLLPCLNNDQRLQVKLQTKFKIFAHQEESFSLGITLPEENIQFFKDLEKHLNCCDKKEAGNQRAWPVFCQISGGRFYSCENRQIRAGKDLCKNLSLQTPKFGFLVSILGVMRRWKEKTHPEGEAIYWNASPRASRFFHQTSFLRKCKSDHMHCG